MADKDKYEALYEYLEKRYANSVVLTFARPFVSNELRNETDRTALQLLRRHVGQRSEELPGDGVGGGRISVARKIVVQSWPVEL